MNPNFLTLPKFRLYRIFFVAFALGSVSSCSQQVDFEKELVKTLEEKPEILAKVIEKNPKVIVGAFQNAVNVYRQELEASRQADEKKKLEEHYKSPLTPSIPKNATFKGSEAAPITLVEYTDFQCPFCRRGLGEVKKLQEKYGKNIRILYKHFPLESIHPEAMMAAKYFEAALKMDSEKAFKLHALIFDNQQKLRTQKEKLIKKLSAEVGLDFKKLNKLSSSEEIAERIRQDVKEAAKFGITGTPGFIINGIPVKGAYPASHFIGIVEKLKDMGKLTL